MNTHTVNSLEDLGALFAGEHAESQPAPEAPKTPNLTLNVLATAMLCNAVQNTQRTPSPTLKPEFRSHLTFVKDMIGEALKRNEGELAALVDTVYAIALGGDRITATRVIRGAMANVLWQTSLHIYRDRNPRDPQSAPDGLVGAASNEDVIMRIRGNQEQEVVTEDDALSAMEEVNGYLDTLISLIVVDENDREFLGLIDGLEYTTKQVPNVRMEHDIDGNDVEITLEGNRWDRVHSVSEAIELQLAKNESSMKKRASRIVQQRSDAFQALRQLGALKKAA